jgi:elongator complex protein 3
MVKDIQRWMNSRLYSPQMLAKARLVLEDVQRGAVWQKAVRHHPLPQGGYVPKHAVVEVYRQLVSLGEWDEDPALLANIRMKPMRSLSGVTTVTVLTKPFPCPGKCIFCPVDLQMPKSYLPDEPGASRAVQNDFDPYRQVKSRLDSYLAVGHPIDKIELLILGGTWSVYPTDYQEWFIQRCFDAMNGFDSKSLLEAQTANENTHSRNVGLVIETRPEYISPAELHRLRQLGVTKVQLGAQSLDDRVLELNQRGHTIGETLKATSLLRRAGFKIVLHWMPNLLGSSLEMDHADFARLWSDGYAPDELKIYPVQLLQNSELYPIWKQGDYQPYSTDELVGLLADIKPTIPPYCRVNRVIRDIPSTHVIAGNKRTSLRQDILAEVEHRGQVCGCIRCHEVSDRKVILKELKLEDFVYSPEGGIEHFLSFRTPEDRIAGYLRLVLPDTKDSLGEAKGFPDLEKSAIIREVHIYGQSLAVGGEQSGAAQHIGLGTRLMDRALEISHENGYSRLAVISAIGTRLYYEGRGFQRGELYMFKTI